ncbi:MAG: SDR family oxidoreductase, partial [Actinomycetota bacterium]|nr:SDR family oxidoreductase [Actinomycetota bacterium]
GARTGGIADSCVYSASKAGLLSITKNFARTLGAYGITTNAVLPGGIDTGMASRQFERDETLRDHILSASPLGRLGQAAEVASVVSFLASADSDYVNGASIDVNGGWFMA